jgi:Tol biopolymer transport system component
MQRIQASSANAMAELEKILVSPVFSTADRASRLLRFLVQETVEGRADGLKEYTLGTSVLGRKPAFDPRIDPIARVEASRLRDRLELYYATDGRSDAVVISLPKGGYVPVFEMNEPETAVPAAVLEPPVKLRLSWRRIAVIGAGLALAGIGTFALLYPHAQPGPSFRLSVVPPPNASIESFAISPDGARLAVAVGSQNTSSLFVRPLNSFTYQKLAGTEGAWNPFWSPDGRSIGFFTPGKLKVIETSTGSVRTLCEAGLGRGGSWSRSGDIVFASGALGPLYRIPASGGKRTPATWIDSGRGETGHRWPQFLPDGRHFLYFAAAAEYDRLGISIGDLDSRTARRIIAADTNGSFVPDSSGTAGHLLFVRHGALSAQVFDPTQFRTIGDPVAVLPEVNYAPLSRYAQFSVSGTGVLAYLGGSPFNQELTWFDRRGVAVGRAGEPGDFSGLHLSPDGMHALFNRSDPKMGYPEVWTVDLRRGSTSRITSGSVDFSPVWSPDGRQVIFARASLADRGMTLSQASSDGGQPHPLSNLAGAGFPSSWSSNGRYVAYTGFVGHGGSGIYILTIHNNEAGELREYLETENNESGAVFSPAQGAADPKWVAYTSDESGREEVYIQSLPRTGIKLQVSPAGGSQAQWRPDGRGHKNLPEAGSRIAEASVPHRSPYDLPGAFVKLCAFERW